MKSLNLGILAHIDAGKTSLTERLLFNAGVISQIGSVDAGSTQTDSLALERQRGITIKSAVASLTVDDVAINILDTPGHPDFIAEVERVLSVLDGAVLVISAVEGVQAQTRILMRTLQRLRIPTVIFVNKIDRRGARYDSLLRDIAQKLTPSIMPMGTVAALGTRAAQFVGYAPDDRDFTAQLADQLAEDNHDLLAQRIASKPTPAAALHRELAHQTKQALVHPVFFGSAITGTGVAELTRQLTSLLPTAAGDPAGTARGRIFKIERGPAGEKIAFVRMFAGTLSVRDSVRFGRGHEGKITALQMFDRGAATATASLQAGDIGKVWGLSAIQIGDAIGETSTQNEHFFAPPTLETAVAPRTAADKTALYAALAQLAEQDPLINLRQDDTRQELYLSLYGEVQKEVIEATLLDDFGIAVDFTRTTTLCVERPNNTGQAVEGSERGAPFLGTVGLRIEPVPPRSGVRFRLAQEVLGTMPLAFFKAVEDTVYETLQQGLYGWRVIDCVVTMTHARYFPRQSHAHARFDKSMSSTGADFRGLTPLVLMDALQRAGTTVQEPLHRFELEIPADALSTVLQVLAKLGAIPEN